LAHFSWIDMWEKKSPSIKQQRKIIAATENIFKDNDSDTSNIGFDPNKLHKVILALLLH